MKSKFFVFRCLLKFIFLHQLLNLQSEINTIGWNDFRKIQGKCEHGLCSILNHVNTCYYYWEPLGNNVIVWININTKVSCPDNWVTCLVYLTMYAFSRCLYRWLLPLSVACCRDEVITRCSPLGWYFKPNLQFNSINFTRLNVQDFLPT